MSEVTKEEQLGWLNKAAVSLDDVPLEIASRESLIKDSIRQIVENSGKLIILNIKDGKQTWRWEPCAKTYIEKIPKVSREFLEKYRVKILGLPDADGFIERGPLMRILKALLREAGVEVADE